MYKQVKKEKNKKLPNFLLKWLCSLILPPAMNKYFCCSKNNNKKELRQGQYVVQNGERGDWKRREGRAI
jgi:hypothetical protein